MTRAICQAITPTAGQVYIMLDLYQRLDLPALVHLTMRSERAIRKALASLESLGLIKELSTGLWIKLSPTVDNDAQTTPGNARGANDGAQPAVSASFQRPLGAQTTPSNDPLERPDVVPTPPFNAATYTGARVFGSGYSSGSGNREHTDSHQPLDARRALLAGCGIGTKSPAMQKILNDETITLEAVRGWTEFYQRSLGTPQEINTGQLIHRLVRGWQPPAPPTPQRPKEYYIPPDLVGIIQT